MLDILWPAEIMLMQSTFPHVCHPAKDPLELKEVKLQAELTDARDRSTAPRGRPCFTASSCPAARCRRTCWHAG